MSISRYIYICIGIFVALFMMYGGLAYTAHAATVTLSGTLYSDEGSTQITGGETIKVAVGTTTVSVHSTSTDGGAGAWHIDISDTNLTSSTTYIVWVDGNASTRASVVVNASTTGSIANIDLYQNRVIVKHENSASSTSITDMATYDATDDSDIMYDASSTASTLTLNKGQELHIWTGDTFAPGGTVTLNGNGASSPDGDFHLDDSATYTEGGILTVAGDFNIDTGSTFTEYAGGTVFNATTTGKTLTGTLTGTNALGNVTFNGSGGGWTFSNNASTSDLTITNGTVVASTSLTIGGRYTNNGTFTAGGGTVYFGGDAGFNLYLQHTQSFSVATEETAPYSLAFNTDGTKMFVVGTFGQDVNEYTLSTGFDVSTASFVDSFSVSAQETAPTGLAFSTSGTKMFVIGTAGDDVNEYTLGTGFDVSTASFVDSFSVVTQEGAPTGLAFNTDGTKMFVLGRGGDEVNEYSLSTGFDVSTASFVDNFYVGAQESNPYGLAFSTSGTKMFVIGSVGDDVNEYTLSTGFDVTTASFVDSFSVSAQDVSPTGLAFNTDGTKMFVTGPVDDDINEYSILTEHSGTMVGSSAFNNVVVAGGDSKFLASASTTDLTIQSGATATALANTLTISGNYQNDGGFDSNQGSIELTGTSKTISGDLIGSNNLNNVTITGSYTASNTASTSNLTIASGGSFTASTSLTIGGNYTNNGTFDSGSGDVVLDIRTEDLDVINANYTQSFYIGGQETSPSGLAFNTDGTKMFVIGYSGDDVNEYTLSTAYDVSTLNFVDSFSVSAQGWVPTDLAFNTDGTKMFVVEDSDDYIDEYTLGTGFDVSTASFVDGFYIGTQEGQSTAVGFSTDGTKMFVLGRSGDDVNEYTLGTGFDVSTASFVDSFSVATEEANPYGLAFNTNGTKMFVMGTAGDDVNEYTLSTSFDVSTASFVNSFYIGTQEANSQGLAFNTDGTKMFVIGYSGDDVNEYLIKEHPTFSGTMTGASAFNDLTLSSILPTTFSANASISDLTISSGTVAVTMPTLLSIKGDYTNNSSSVVDFGTGTTTFNGTTAQTATGTMTGTSAFYNLEITNSSATTSFGTAVTADNKLTVDTPNAIIEFPGGATSTFSAINLSGSNGNEITLRSTAPGTQWGFDVTTQDNVSYVDVRDSTACSGNPDISAMDSTDSTNNSCWSFPVGLVISGTLYSDEGSTQITGGETIKLAIGTSTPATVYSTTTDSGAGTYSFTFPTPHGIEAGTPVVAWVDGNASTRASVVTKAFNVGPISGLNLYKNRVIIKHESTATSSGTNLTDMATYDATDDSDIQYDASSTASTLTLNKGQELHIWTGDTFTPGGSVTLNGNGASSPDGDFHLDDSATFTSGGVITVAGDFDIDTGSTFTEHADGIVFNATTTGKTFTGTLTGTNALGNVTFNGSGGGWTFSNNASTTDFTITDGTAVAPTALTIGGRYTNNGTFTASSGTIYFGGIDNYNLPLQYAQSLSTISEDSQPKDLVFNTDGTKMFMLGTYNDDVTEYTLSTAYDISTASAVGNFYLWTQDTSAIALAFNTDGTKMFVLGNSGDDVNEYSLSIGFDVTTASFVDSFSISAQDVSPAGLTFNTDGTKMFVVGQVGDDVNEYTLATGFDVSTASFVDSFSVATEDTSPNGIVFNTDGTKMFMSGTLNDKVYEYTLSTAFDVSTASFVDSFYIGTQVAFAMGLAFNADGTKLFIVGGSLDIIAEYTVGAEVNGAMTDSSAFNNVVMTGGKSVFITNASTSDFIIQSGADAIAPTSTLTIAGNYQNDGGFDSNEGTIELTGTSKTISGDLIGSSNLYDVTITGSYTASNTASTSNLTIASGGSFTAPSLLTIGGNYTNNGTFTAGSGEVVADAEAPDLTDANYTQNFNVNAQEASPSGIAFNTDGTKMFVVGWAGDDVNEYTLGTGFDISTASFVDSFIVTEESNPRDLAFNTDGTKMFVVGATGDDVNEYTLGAAFDVSTASFVDSFSIATEEITPTGLAFSTSGTKMFVLGLTGDDVNEYSLSTGFDVSTASFVDSFYIGIQEATPTGLAFNTDGTKMFVSGDAGNDVNEYTLSTGFDVSTASYFQNFSIVTEEADPFGLAFSTDGTKLFVLGQTGDNVHEYFLGGKVLSTFSGTMTGANAFNNLTLSNTAPLTFSANASTSDLTINSGNAEVTMPTLLSIKGDYTNNSSNAVDFGTGTTTFIGTTAQTATGTMTGTAAFYNLEITNNSATTTFSTAVTANNRLTVDTPNVVIKFPAGATSTFSIINLQGTSGNEITLLSTIPGTQWGFDVTTQDNVTYVDVRDSNACSGNPNISNIGDTNINSGGNTCWILDAASVNITFSGILYSDEGTTQITGGETIKIAIGTSTPATVHSTTTDSGAGTWSFPNLSTLGFAVGTPLVAWVDGSASTSAVTIVSSPSATADITDIDLYQNRVILRDNTSIEDMATYDATDDSDIQYDASSTASTLTIKKGQELHIWTGDTFAPGGSVTLNGNGASSPDGDFHLAATSTYIGEGTLTVAGDFDIDTGSTYTKHASGTVFNATTTGKTLTGTLSGTNALGNVTFNGSGGGWTFSNNASTSDLTITDGTVTAPYLFTIAGDYLNNGAFIAGSGLVTFSSTSTQTIGGTLTGSSAFNNVTLAESGAKTFSANASTTNFTIATTSGNVTMSPLFSIVSEYTNNSSNLVDFGNGTTYFDGNNSFNISDLQYQQTFSLASQEINPSGIAFNTDGTKMFVLGYSGDDVNEYTLSTGFDVSTASFVDSFSVNAQDSTPMGLAFNTDGTKMFVVGFSGGNVNEYTLGTGFDVSTASFVDSFGTGGQEAQPRGLAFSLDGTKMFVVGYGNDNVNEYTLGTGFDVSTASFVDSFYVGTEELTPTGLTFSTDGTKMFVTGQTGDNVYEYNLATAYDVSTASFGDSLSIIAGDAAVTGLTFSTDGTKMFVLGDSSNEVNEYFILTEHSGTMVGSSAFNNVVMTGGDSRFLASASTSDFIIQSGATTTAPTSTLTISGNYQNDGGFDSNQGSIELTGTSKIVSGNLTGNNDLNNVTVTGSYTASNNASTSNFTIASGGSFTAPTLLTVGGNYTNNGTFDSGSGDVVLDISAEDLSVANANYVQNFSVNAQETTPTSLAFNTDGTKMFVLGFSGDDVNEYTLSTGFDVSTASFVDSFYVGTQEATPYGLTFSTDGTKMFVVGASGDDVNEYTLGTGFDVSTASFVDSFYVGTQETNPYGIAFSTDGTKMFVVGSNGDDVNEYTLGTGFDVSTASFVDSFYVGTQDTSPMSLTFSSDGTKMFVVGISGDNVYEYTLGTGFDVSTASFVDSFSVAAQETTPYGLAFNSDNTKMFILGPTYDEVYEYLIKEHPTLSGTMTGGSAFNNLTLSSVLPTTFSANANISDLTIGSGNATVTMPTLLTIKGDYTNNSSNAVDFETGTTTFSGTSLQTATGTLDGTAAFSNVSVTNTSGTDAQSTPSIIFGTTASSSGNLTITDPGVMVQFAKDATTTWNDVTITGDSGDYVQLRSTESGTQWNLAVIGTTSAEYVYVEDSNACASPSGNISASSSFDSTGNNNCWDGLTVPPQPTISSAANQTFSDGDSATTISTITITDASTSQIKAVNDIRIVIATSAVGMQWNTSDTTATFGGTASGLVSNPVSYEGGGSVLVIPVDTNFSANDTLTIDNLSFTQFTSVNTATTALSVRTDGSGDSIDNATDDKTVTIIGSLTLSDHDLGQVSNTFYFQNKTNTELFAFKLDPGTGEDSTISAISFDLSSVRKIDSGNITNITLHRDIDADGAYDAEDTAIAGAGAFSVSDETGSISFSTTFSATTSQNYLLVSDVASVKTNEYMTIDLLPSDITSVGSTTGETITPTGSASTIQHIRSGGAGGSTSEVGTIAPVSVGTGTGGTDEGGSEIGNSPGFFDASANGTPNNEWTTPGNAYVSDGSYTTAASADLKQSYATFGFNTPGGSITVDGIEVKLEASAVTGTGTIQVALSWDGGTSVTSVKATTELTNTDSVYTLGGPSDTWGRSWTTAELSDANFRVRVIAQPDGNTVQIDAVQVNPNLVASGGGGGGGGEVSIPSSRFFASVYHAFGDTAEKISGIFKRWVHKILPTQKE